MVHKPIGGSEKPQECCLQLIATKLYCSQSQLIISLTSACRIKKLASRANITLAIKLLKCLYGGTRSFLLSYEAVLRLCDICFAN